MDSNGIFPLLLLISVKCSRPYDPMTKLALHFRNEPLDVLFLTCSSCPAFVFLLLTKWVFPCFFWRNVFEPHLEPDSQYRQTQVRLGSIYLFVNIKRQTLCVLGPCVQTHTCLHCCTSLASNESKKKRDLLLSVFSTLQDVLKAV